MAIWYCGSTKYTAITQWAAATAYSVGDIRRQLATPSLNDERVFRCTTAGTSGGSEPAWNLGKGATTNDNGTVWTEVTGNSTYGWNAAAPRQRLFMNGGSSWAAAGDTVRVHENHAESQTAGVTYSSPGTASAPLRVITVNDGLTALATTATVTVNGGANNFNFNGFAYVYGMTYIGSAAGGTDVGFSDSATNWWKLDNCAFQFTGNSAITIGANASSLDDRLVEFENVNITFGNTSGGFTLHGRLIWKGGSVLGSTVPNTLITNVTTGPGGLFYGHSLDLSVLGSGKTLVAAQSGTMGDILFENCRLGASVAFTSGSIPGQGGLKIRFVNCDSGATNYNFHDQDYQGTITDESVIVYLADISRKMVSSANVSYFSPLVLDDIVVYNTIIGGARTANIQIVSDGVTFNNDEIWAEVECLGNASYPLGVITRDRISDPVFGTPAAQTSSVVPWTTTGLASPIKQVLEVSFTPQIEGIVKIRVMLAKASTTVYVDPKVALS